MAGMKAAPLLALALGACATAPHPNGDPAALAAAESAFAAQSVREDMRAAFMAHFAPGGVFVRDGWVAAREWLAGRPAPAVVLDWRPAYVEVAGSGELGLSTGPWKLAARGKPEAAPAFGQFVSVWQRLPGEPWRVLVDLGISHPGPALWEAPLEARVARTSRPLTALAEAEARFQARAREGLAAAYAAWGAADLRYYRDGLAPASSRATALAAMAAPPPGAWHIEETRTAGSGDFGFTRGSFGAAPGTPPEGYFLRVWRHEPNGWRIALDVVQPAPKR